MAGNQREMERREKREKKDKRNRIIIWIIIAVIIAVLAIMKIFEINVNSIKEKFTDENGGFSLTGSVENKNLPYNIDASQNVKLINFNNRLGVLTPGSFTVLDGKTADEEYTFAHGYSNPVLASGGIYSLVYDQGGNNYRIDTVSQSVYEEVLDSTILCADVAKNGAAAIATASKEKLCDIKVFSLSLEKKLDISISDGYIIDIAVSDNGKQVAAVAARSADADLITTVMFFNTDGTQGASVELPSGSPADIRFDGKSVWVVGDTYIGVIKNGKYSEVFEQGSVNVQCFNYSSSGDLVAAFSDYSNSVDCTVAYIKSGGKIKSQFRCESGIKAISATDTLASVLTADSIISYNLKNGEEKQRADVSDSVKTICRLGSTVYVHKQSVIDAVTKSEEQND